MRGTVLRLAHNGSVKVSEREWIVLGVGVITAILMLSLALNAGYAMAFRDLLLARERRVVTVPIRDREPE